MQTTIEESCIGGLMVELILRAASQCRTLPYDLVAVDCDNTGVMKHGNLPAQALQEKQAQANILQVFELILIELLLEVIYCWVAAHQDDKRK